MAWHALIMRSAASAGSHGNYLSGCCDSRSEMRAPIFIRIGSMDHGHRTILTPHTHKTSMMIWLGHGLCENRTSHARGVTVLVNDLGQASGTGTRYKRAFLQAQAFVRTHGTSYTCTKLHARRHEPLVLHSVSLTVTTCNKTVKVPTNSLTRPSR